MSRSSYESMSLECQGQVMSQCL